MQDKLNQSQKHAILQHMIHANIKLKHHANGNKSMHWFQYSPRPESTRSWREDCMIAIIYSIKWKIYHNHQCFSMDQISLATSSRLIMNFNKENIHKSHMLQNHGPCAWIPCKNSTFFCILLVSHLLCVLEYRLMINYRLACIHK